MCEWLATESALWALFASAFISSTLFPGGSEAVLLGIVASRNTWEGAWPALLVATAGNTLGSLTGWAIGRFFPEKSSLQGHPKAEKILSLAKRRGVWLLLFSWLPVVGDFLPVASGWLRHPFLLCALFIGVGKFLRYILLTALWFGTLG